MSPENWIAIIALALSVYGGGFGALVWLQKKFETIESNINKAVDKILDKLEYHERHDDERFSQMDKNLWEQKLRMVSLEVARGKTFDQEENTDKPQYRRQVAAA